MDLTEKFPELIYDGSYFTDAIFIGNNPSLGLDIIEIISDPDDGRVKYHAALVEHFENKGYPVNEVNRKAKDYLSKLDRLNEFFHD